MKTNIYKFCGIAFLMAFVLPAIGQNSSDSVAIDDEWSTSGYTIEVNRQGVSKTTYDDDKIEISTFPSQTKTKAKASSRQTKSKVEINILGRNQYRAPKNKSTRRSFSQNFVGHWSGIYLGLTNYLDSDGKIYSSNSDLMGLDWSGSRTLILNPFQHDISLSRNGCFGLVLGAGFEYQRLRFSDDYTSIQTNDRGEIVPLHLNRDYNVRRNTLKHLYLTMPVLLEIQTRKDAFISFGVIGAVRLHSKTKVVYRHEGDKRKLKNVDDFSMIPFKLDATARIGFGEVAIFCNYTLTKMFENNKGANVFPLTIGIGYVWWE